MSESEGKKELAGLARSVDALFGGGSDDAETPIASPPPLPDPASEATNPPVVAAEGSVSEPDVHLPLDVSSEDLSGPADGSSEAGRSGLDSGSDGELGAGDTAFEMVPEIEFQPTIDAGAEPPIGAGSTIAVESELEPVPDSPGAASPVVGTEDVASDSGLESGAEPDEELEAEDPEAVAGEGLQRAAAGSDPDGEEEPPTPLDLAVDAYLGGDPTQGDEIKRLADELVERKEFESIARSVARLVLAAGNPPDAAVYAVAASIMSPVVLGRLSRRIGAERDEARRRDYFQVCATIGEEMAIALRDDLAGSTDRLSRRIHYDALVSMGAASRSVIEEMAVDDNRFLVRNAVSILGDTGGDNAVELVTSALANPDSRVRREALLSLAKLGDEEAGQLVAGFLDDPEAVVRNAAVIASGELRVERALKSLIEMTDASLDEDELIPLMRALGQIGDPGAVASIEKHAVRPLFSKPRTPIRIAAYRALAAIGTPHARRLLNQAVTDKDPEVKAAVKDALHMR